MRSSMWKGRPQARFYDALEWLYGWSAEHCPDLDEAAAWEPSPESAWARAVPPRDVADRHPALIDSHRSAASRLDPVLVGCAVVMDGFDVQAMGFVAPAGVADDITNGASKKAALRARCSARLCWACLVGSLVLSICADRFGRRGRC